MENDNFGESYLRDQVWPGNTFVREVLVALHETDDVSTPSDIRTDIDSMKHGWSTSIQNERANKQLSDLASLSRQGMLVPASAWGDLQFGSLLTDHGRHKVPVSPQASAIRPNRMSKSLFEHKACPQGCSLPDKLIDKIADDCSTDFLHLLSVLPREG